MEQQAADLTLNVEQSVTERVLSLKRLGRSIRQIADAVGLPPTSVHRLIHAHEEQNAPDSVLRPPDSLLARLEQERHRATKATTEAQRTCWDAREQLREAEIALRVAETALKAAPASGALEMAGRVREAKARVEDTRAIVAVLTARWQAASEAEIQAGAKYNEARGRVPSLQDRIKRQRQAVWTCQQTVKEAERMVGGYRNSVTEAEQLLRGLERDLIALQGEEEPPKGAA